MSVACAEFARLKGARRVALALRAWRSLVSVAVGLRRRSLPELVAIIGQPRPPRPLRYRPARLGRAVSRLLHVGPLRPRCLLSALVLYRLLREQGDEAQLVIGLPSGATGKDAHAWVELDGVDVGPPPGRGDHQEMVRYG